MTSDRFAQLKPPAIISTVASLPRRFGETFVPAPTADPDEVANLVGDDGRSMLDLVATTTATLKMLHGAVAHTASDDQAQVPAGTLDPSQRTYSSATGDRVAELASLETITEGLVATLKSLSGKDWGRVASVDGAGTASIEELGQEAARSAITELGAAAALAKTF